MSNQKEAGNQVSIKVDDQTLKGVYANAMQVAHTKEEFIMDFINLFCCDNHSCHVSLQRSIIWT